MAASSKWQQKDRREQKEEEEKKEEGEEEEEEKEEEEAVIMELSWGWVMTLYEMGCYATGKQEIQTTSLLCIGRRLYRFFFLAYFNYFT